DLGKLRIRHPQQYIREQVHRHLGLQLRLAEEEIITAGKISIGKGSDYWLDLCHKGAAHLFALEEELPQFLHDPKGYAARLDPDLYEAFSRKVHEPSASTTAPSRRRRWRKRR
ncbi:hypothetical protein RZS08_38535, partial [Arthrospira platensis SPKY1]|nr:hypothetical protein [Arthrospira platensis SPKY1]